MNFCILLRNISLFYLYIIPPFCIQEQPPSIPQSSTSADGEPKNPHVCVICNKSFKTRDYLKRHTKTHKKEPMACDQCKFTSVSSRDFALHRETHQEIKSCQHCDFTTKKAKELAIHRRIHIEPYVCPLCDFTSKNIKEFSNHKKTHPEPHQCPHCQYQTQRIDCIKKHLQRHREQNEHQCNLCNFSSPSRAYLAKHMKNNHGTQLSKSSEVAS